MLNDLLALSDADHDVLGEIWQKFGAMTGFQLRDYTHANCPEWHDPDGSMIPVRPDELFRALGFTDAQGGAYMARMQEQAAINAQLGQPLR